MKTIFDKIDTKYIDCTTGACEHISHAYNASYIAIAAVLILAISIFELNRR